MYFSGISVPEVFVHPLAINLDESNQSEFL